jgi:hypothetical protein
VISREPPEPLRSWRIIRDTRFIARNIMKSLLAISLAGALAASVTVALAQTGTTTGAGQPGQPGAGQTTQGTTTTNRDEPGNPAIKSPAPNSDRPGTAATGKGAGDVPAPPLSALERGSNSFTEGQARSRLEDAGFNNITGLAQDESGIWGGKAQRNGQTVTVGVDYKGNVGSE